ncbi:hypothetical protein JA1_002420 [Spathaspora sp. JA1]|nr:hypothetical protein JA1_002420 [Spathaspora sp. JA1]
MFQPPDNTHHHHYPSAYSIFPTSSSIRDVIAVVFIIQSLPMILAFLLLIVYIILGSNFIGGKFLINIFLVKSESLFTKRWGKYLVLSVGKMGIIDLIIYVGLSQGITRNQQNKIYFNYLITLAHSIVASELIGVNSINYINTITIKRITTKIQYDNNWFINQRFINSLICFVIINYITYVINWLNYSLQLTVTNVVNVPADNYLYLIISIHIIFQTILFKNSSILQNSIPNLSDEVSINVDDNKLLDIDVTSLKQIPSPNRQTIELKNFENFIISPIHSKLKTDNIVTTTTTNKTVNNTTTINNKILIQPFWNIIAALKSILKNKNLFNGSKDFINKLNMSVVLCDNNKIILQNLTGEMSDVTVKLNQINWMSYKIIDNYLIVYDLSPCFKYEIVLYNKEEPINKTVVVTTGTGQIYQSGSLGTIQTSLSTTMTKLSQLRSKFKKYKRDENKRIGELRNSIDLIKTRIAKQTSPQYNDIRLMGKIKGLNQTVIQLEQDISNLTTEIDELTEQEHEQSQQFEIKDEEFVEKCQFLELEYEEYYLRINKIRLQLKNIKHECQTILTKNHKLKIKQLNKQDEIKQLINELNDIKTLEILTKFTNRIKKTNDKFDYILPKIIHETELLTKQQTINK